MRELSHYFSASWGTKRERSAVNSFRSSCRSARRQSSALYYSLKITCGAWIGRYSLRFILSALLIVRFVRLGKRLRLCFAHPWSEEMTGVTMEFFWLMLHSRQMLRISRCCISLGSRQCITIHVKFVFMTNESQSSYPSALNFFR